MESGRKACMSRRAFQWSLYGQGMSEGAPREGCGGVWQGKPEQRLFVRGVGGRRTGETGRVRYRASVLTRSVIQMLNKM